MIKIMLWNGRHHEEVQNRWGGLVEVFKAFPSTVYTREVLEGKNTVIFIRPKI